LAKKNPYIFTIGFNAKDPEHVEVVKVLNNQGKGNIASLIVKAVLSYTDKTNISNFDLESIKPILQNMVDIKMEILIEELGNFRETSLTKPTQRYETKDAVSDDMKSSIMEDLNAFRRNK